MMMMMMMMNCTHHLGNETSTWCCVLCVHVTSVLCCSVLSSVIVLASCQTRTPDNENSYCHRNDDQLDVIDTLCTDERVVSTAVNNSSYTLYRWWWWWQLETDQVDIYVLVAEPDWYRYWYAWYIRRQWWWWWWWWYKLPWAVLVNNYAWILMTFSTAFGDVRSDVILYSLFKSLYTCCCCWWGLARFVTTKWPLKVVKVIQVSEYYL